MKKIISLFTAFAIALSLMVSVPIEAFAAEAVTNLWSVGWTVDKEYIGYKNNDTEVSVDTKVHYKTSRSSIKISNKGFTQCQIRKTVKVEPLTTYTFSAMVKYADFKIAPGSKMDYNSAHLSHRYVVDGEWKNFSYSKTTTSNEWVKLETTFTTLKDQNEVDLLLLNGVTGSLCKGTAWFSDIKLEKAELTNEWNVLVVAYKNIDVNVDLNNKTTVLKSKGKGLTNYKNSYTDAEIKEFQKVTKNLYSAFDTMSGGLADVKDIDFITVKEPINELTTYDYAGDKWGSYAIHGYRMDETSECFKKVIDKQLKKKHYNAIVILAPLEDIAGGWGGLNGSYKNSIFTVISNMGNLRHEGFPELSIVHELLHQLEAITRKFYDPAIPNLHSGSDYGYKSGPKEDHRWYSDYMKSKIAGTKNKGIDPRAYWLPNGKYTLIDGDMTTAGDIKEAALLDISKCKVEKVKDHAYSGKKITPSLTIKDGNYTLKKGIDYTVKFSNNTKKGKATAVITGKGLYKGTLKTTFNIVAGKPSVKVKKSADYLTLSWSNFSDVDKYIVWRSTDGGEFKKVCEVDGSKSGKKFKYSKNHTYQFAVTAYNASTGEYTEYIYTDTVKT